MSDQQDTQEQAETSQDKLANNSSLLQSIMLNSFALGSFALICTIIIALTYINTADNIKQQKKLAQLTALYQIVPKNLHDNDLLTDNINLQVEQLRASSSANHLPCQAARSTNSDCLSSHND